MRLRPLKREEINSIETTLVALQSAVTRLGDQLADAQRGAQEAERALHDGRTCVQRCSRSSLQNWTVEDVAAWVNELEEGAFSQYAQGFRTNEIDGKELLTFECQAEFQECGVASRPERKKLWA